MLIFLSLHTGASFYYISQQNITFDEPQYIEYAKRWLHGKPERIVPLDDSKSPVVAICWAPRIVRQCFNPNYRLNDYGRKDQAEGRYMMILFSFLTALYVYKWCRDLYGFKGWWLPLFLLLFDPLYLAYSTLITTDLACGAFLVALLYHYKKYLHKGHLSQLYIAGLYTGLAIVTKQTMVFSVLLLPILSIINWSQQNMKPPAKLKRVAFEVVIFVIILLLVINVTYYFHHTFIPFEKYVFESQTFIQLQKALPLLHKIPIPLPEAYIQSLDMIKAHAEYGPGKLNSTYNGVYLFGKLNLTGGYWYYYLVTFLFKMPLGNLLLIFSSVFLFVKIFNKKSFCIDYSFLVLPIIFYGILLSFFNNFQTGIRHLLLVFPLLYIGLGKLFVEVAKMRLRFQWVIGALVLQPILSLGLFYPFIIPYTNELVTNKKEVYNIMMDSSIDYGQSDSSIRKFMIDHPNYSIPAIKPITGRFALPMAHVIDRKLPDQNPYNWYQKMRPCGLYRNVVLIYNISRKDLINAGFVSSESNAR